MSVNFLTAKDAAERLGVKPITIRVWLGKGLFPNAKLENMPPFGEVWRIPESDLTDFKKPVMGRPKKAKDAKRS